MVAQNSDLVVVGHLSIDTILMPIRSKPFMVLGGAATYTSIAAKRLDTAVSVISKVGENYPQAYLWWLDQEGIDTSAVSKIAGEQTTCFELAYSKDLSERAIKLKSKGPTISVADVPKDFRAKAVHFGPIANEIPYELVEHLKGCVDILSLDPQGLLRNFDEAGNVARTDAIFSASSGNFVDAPGKLAALVGVRDLVIVDTPDALLVADRSRAQQVSDLVKLLERLKRDDLL